MRQTGDQISKSGGCVRLVTQVDGAWKYRALSVVVLPPSALSATCYWPPAVTASAEYWNAAVVICRPVAASDGKASSSGSHSSAVSRFSLLTTSAPFPRVARIVAPRSSGRRLACDTANPP